MSAGCHALDLATNTWSVRTTNFGQFSNAGYSYSKAVGLIVTGGFISHTNILTAVRSTKDGRTFRTHASMPRALHSHCQVGINCHGVQYYKVVHHKAIM